jgi:phosphatidylglycerophosphate synthase
MEAEKKLVTNIIIVIISLLVFQAIFFGIVSGLLNYDANIIVLFYVITIMFHLTMLGLLIFLRDRFRFEDGTCCEYINIPNILTLFRISSIPTIFFFFTGELSQASLIFILPFVAIVFATDFLDGIIARSLKQITTIGKYLDSTSDYLLLFFTAIIFLVYGLIPIWFFILLVVRLASHAAGILLISALKKSIVFSTSFLGKASVAATMILFVIELVRHQLPEIPALEIVFIAIEVITGVIVFASLVEKSVILWKEWRRKTIGDK